MFLASSDKPIDSTLQTAVEKLEQTSPGISVLAARQFRYRLEQTSVELMVTAPRKFNILEEFILRASLEITPAPTEDELAQVLGLDPIFVRSTTANLQALNTLKVASGGEIQLTLQGRNFYQKGSVPQPPELQPVYAIADPLIGAVAFEPNPLGESSLNLPDLGDFLPLSSRIQAVESLTLTEIQQLLCDRGLGFHLPESGKEVTAFQVVEPPQSVWQSAAIFAIFDAIDERCTLQVRRGQQLLESATLWLEMLQTEDKISLTELFQISEKVILHPKNQEVESRLKKVRQAAVQTLKSREEKTAKNTSESGSSVLIRDSQIQKQFLETLQNADRHVLIYSPEITPEVIDDCFLQLLKTLAKRGVWILLGYGITGEEVLSKLAEVKTPEGISAVQVLELANSHAKEIVIDRQIYLCSSHHALSDPSDRLLRGETLYQVTIPEQVTEAYNYLSSQFNERAESLWQEALTHRDASLATTSLAVWGALRMEETSLPKILEQWLDLLPVWLNVACQELRSQQLSPDSAGLSQALLLLQDITVDFPALDSLCEGWRQAIALIATCDRTTALNLLSEPVWKDFTRLGIASETIDSPDAFISTELAKLPQNLPKSNGKTTRPKKPKRQKSN